MSSGWFDCTEPSLGTLLQGKQGVQGAYAIVRGGSSTSNLLEPTRTTASRIARCVEVYHKSSGWFDCTEPSLCTLLQGKQGVQGAYAIVRGGSSTSNLIEPQHHRASKVWRGLSHEFGVVRLYRTFSLYFFAVETRCAGCLSTSSRWFQHIEPHRTYSNHNLTELARCGEVCQTSSGWFDCTEPSLATSLQGFVLVRGGSLCLNHPELVLPL